MATLKADPRSDLEQARERIAELGVELEREREQRINLTRERDAWRDARLPDPEAEALAGCVRAIEGMRETERAARQRTSNFASNYEPSYRGPDDRPTALRSAEGRILLALAARYGLAIEATVPKPPPPVEGERLVALPAAVARQVQELVETGMLR